MSVCKATFVQDNLRNDWSDFGWDLGGKESVPVACEDVGDCVGQSDHCNNTIDYRLKKDVEALAAKLKRDCNLKRKTIKRPIQPVSESCNIVVEGAGVYVV
ncbi:hypothetical protein RR48_00567 [Papilio machaon]|uniref:Uncharacterized protein n=1 Tax=Papilio machaon TaxID=76193 RepID=A0A0N0PCD3_PAPMA|nr:hypothetical protein RR48_00567 [Papilio machaon]